MEILFWPPNSNSSPPVEEFINEQDNKTKKRILKTLEIVEKHDFRKVLSAEIFKKLDDEIYEIRIPFNKIQFRILSTIYNSQIWLLHGVKKKSQKISSSDLRVAKNRIIQLKK